MNTQQIKRKINQTLKRKPPKPTLATITEHQPNQPPKHRYNTITLLKHLDHTIEKTTGTSPNTITSSQKHTRHLKHLAKTQQEWAEYLQSKKLKTDTKYQGTKIFLTNENGNNDQLQHTTHTNTKTQTSQRRLGQMVQHHA